MSPESGQDVADHTGRHTVASLRNTLPPCDRLFGSTVLEQEPTKGTHGFDVTSVSSLPVPLLALNGVLSFLKQDPEIERPLDQTSGDSVSKPGFSLFQITGKLAHHTDVECR